EIGAIREICDMVSAGSDVASPANLNAPGQTVISGSRDAVMKASEQAKLKGAKRVVPLDVSAPFHCILMKPAAERLAEVLDKIEFREMNVPIVTNCDASVNSDSSRTRELLVRQVTSPVRWYESVETLGREGVGKFLEIGPKNVLSGLIKRTLPNVEVGCLENMSQLESLKNGRKG
ncbi:MAG TPA: ACP S-malonyltransferase, partial [Thermodesulfobacteriota bacterium]|nr:ACP S-malonyltransferase [Thermodesulfobacteriota bacterium]